MRLLLHRGQHSALLGDAAMRYRIAGFVAASVLVAFIGLGARWSASESAAASTSSSSSQTNASAENLIPQPDYLVAFSADVRIFELSEPPVYGRFYRASDGSTRYDSGPALDDMRVIAIYNGKTNTRYRYSKAGWFSWRSVEPSKVRKKFRRGLPNLIEIPGRVVVDLERGTYTSVLKTIRTWVFEPSARPARPETCSSWHPT